jgi:class 3 adenylate cyclase
MFLDDLGQRLRERREAQHLTQLDIAQALQVSPQAVSKWERGENAPDIILLATLCGLLGITTDWLLGRHQPAGDTFEGTVLVSSVQGFAARCEGLRPNEIAMWANGFLHQITEATVHEGGLPVKYIGDGLLAFFTGDRHEARAASAALSARNTVVDPLIVGLASGPIYVTSLGHVGYARPDIIGPTVNTAFRINGWTARHANSRIGAAFPVDWPASTSFHGVTHSGLALKGLHSPIDILEITGRS